MILKYYHFSDILSKRTFWEADTLSKNQRFLDICIGDQQRLTDLIKTIAACIKHIQF